MWRFRSREGFQLGLGNLPGNCHLLSCILVSGVEMSDAAKIIRSLMRDLGVSNHVVFEGSRTISARRVLKDLEAEIAKAPAPPVSVVDHQHNLRICNNHSEMLLTLNADGTITFSDRYLQNPDAGVRQFIALVRKEAGSHQPTAPTGISEYGAIDQGYEPNGR